jgi:hypothetical protein
MPTVSVSFFEGRPLLDLRSYGKRGPGRRDHLSPAEIAQISRTVRRVPEVVVKVLPRDSNNFAAVGRHIDYIGRKGELELETDDGERLSGKGVGRELLEDWDLDLDEHRRKAELGSALGRNPPKLVHKLMFSMPPGTPAKGVLAAARNFLREEFALKHRYAFVLHTDEPHPHVHAVVKAVSEQGVRLNIRKATLRQWRSGFAQHLRAVGIEANATERAVRGRTMKAKKDGIYRANLRGDSTHTRMGLEEAASLLAHKHRLPTTSPALFRTRDQIVAGWNSTARQLAAYGACDLAIKVRQFVDRFPPPQTEKELLIAELLQRVQNFQSPDHLISSR